MRSMRACWARRDPPKMAPISSSRRREIYVFVGLLAAVFSLVLGIVFLAQEDSILPSLDPVMRWIGGPNTN